MYHIILVKIDKTYKILQLMTRVDFEFFKYPINFPCWRMENWKFISNIISSSVMDTSSIHFQFQYL